MTREEKLVGELQELRRNRKSLIGQIRGLTAKAERLEEAVTSETKRCAEHAIRAAALEESLRFALDVIEREVPPETCTCNACGDCASAFFFAENMLKARALLQLTKDGGR